MSQRVLFSKSRLDQLQPVPGKRYEVQDEKQPWLRLRVTPNGVKTFCVLRRVKNGKPGRLTLGRFPAMTVEIARSQAAKVVAEIEAGADPVAAKRVLRSEPTFEEAMAEFLPAKRKRNGAPLSEKTKRDYRDLVRLHFGAVRQRKLSDITRADVVRLRDALSLKSKAQADKLVRIISSVYNFMLDSERFTGENPAKRVKTNVPVERERFVEQAEIARLMSALDALSSETMRHFFYLALFTGIRRGNLCAVRWSDVNFDTATVRLPQTKNGTPQVVPLTPIAIEIFETRRRHAEPDAEFVFPGDGRTGHMIAPSKAWRNVCEEGGLTNLRIHDLRRTLGSWLANNGTSLHIIGQSLNHKSPRSTVIYARLETSTVRAAVDAATSRMVAIGRPLVSIAAGTANDTEKVPS